MSSSYCPILLLVLVIVAVTQAKPFNLNELEHEDVKQVLEQEALLPPHLKNPFYQNPHIREVLAKHSWFANGEMPIKKRFTQDIPRKEIFTVLNHAGLLPQQTQHFL